MRFRKYLKEDAVSAALNIPEPEVGKKYPPEKVKRYIQQIDAAISAMAKKEESEANDAVISDLRDKKSKWSNVKKETKPTKTKQQEPPPDQEEPPPEEEPPPDQGGGPPEEEQR
jgi:hypothetical protein